MKYAIQTSLGEIIHKSATITDAMRFYVQVNPLASIVRRTRKGWVRL